MDLRASRTPRNDANAEKRLVGSDVDETAGIEEALKEAEEEDDAANEDNKEVIEAGEADDDAAAEIMDEFVDGNEDEFEIGTEGVEEDNSDDNEANDDVKFVLLHGIFVIGLIDDDGNDEDDVSIGGSIGSDGICPFIKNLDKTIFSRCFCINTSLLSLPRFSCCRINESSKCKNGGE